jgi:hypothetical protein
MRGANTALIGWFLGMFLAAQSAPAQVSVYVAYYDNEHPNSTIPTPWSGSSATTFFGGTDSTGVWDGGAIRFTNTGPQAAVLKPGLHVSGFANGASFELWDSILAGGRTIGAGQTLILAQPTTGGFDTSDQPIIDNVANRTQNHPLIQFTLNDQPYALTDTHQVLNTGGFDPGNALIISESEPWALIAVVPEPGSGAVIAAAFIVLLRRRR